MLHSHARSPGIRRTVPEVVPNWLFQFISEPATTVTPRSSLVSRSSRWEVVEVICTFTHARVLTVSVPTTFFRYSLKLSVDATKWKISKNKNVNSLSLRTSSP